MDRDTIINSLAIQLAVKICDSSPANAVEKYFELLPTVRNEYDRIKASQTVPKAKTISKSDFGL